MEAAQEATFISRVESINQALLRQEDQLENLHSLNVLLNSSNNEDILRISSIINPEQIFHLLDQQDKPDEVHLVCSIISKMLLPVPAEQLVRLSQYLELGLQHQNETVRAMTLQLVANRTNSSNIISMLSKPTMFHLVTQLLGDESLECAKHSSKVITALAKQFEGETTIDMTTLDIDLKGLLEQSSIVRYRVFDLVVSMSCLSKIYFDQLKSLRYFEMLVSDVHSNDVLVKLNCLEVLEVLMSTVYGCEYIQHHTKVIQELHAVLQAVDTDPLLAILIPGILKFFGHFCKYSPSGALEIATKYPLFVQLILRQIFNPFDSSQLRVAMDTFMLLGSTHKLRPILLTQQNEVNPVIQKLWEYALQSQSDLQVRALDVLTALFSCETDTELLNSDWFDLCPFQTPLSTIMTIVKRPFSDLQLSGLRLILSLSTWEWGQKHIKKCPGLLEYLMDRKTISDTRGKQVKFDIISTLANSPSAESVFGSPVFVKLAQYVREGAFYVADELSVALDDS